MKSKDNRADDNFLVNKALEKHPTHVKAACGRQEQRLALAWAMGNVRFTQVAQVLNRKSSNSIYCFLALSLREAMRNGLLHE